MNIVKTIFIMILIVVGSVEFERITKELVLNPLEIMLEIVDMVETDPLIAKNPENLKMGVKNLSENIDSMDDDKKKKAAKLKAS